MGEIALISLGLTQVGSIAWEAVKQIPGGVAGNFAHELVKGVYGSLRERAARGELAANHDLVRACRRSRLLATHFAAKQFASERRALAKNGNGKTQWEARWADALADRCWEEALQTRDATYLTPRSALDGKTSELIAAVEGVEDAGSALQTRVVEELIAELRAWHAHAWGHRPEHSQPNPPHEFEARLRSGWPYIEVPSPWHVRWLIALKLRRGRVARLVRASQEEVARTRDGQGNMSWYVVFAAFFAEELKTNGRVQAIVTAQLLAQINGRLQVAQQTSTITEADLGRMLTEGFAHWGRWFCSELEQLHQAVVLALHNGQRETLDRLATLETRQERDHALQVAIKGTVDAIHSNVLNVVQLLEAQSFRRAGVDVPRQLPPEPVVGKLVGRVKELAWLRDRLARGKHAAVVGPAGFGKTALASAAVRDVVGPDDASLRKSPFPDGVVFLDLYQLKAKPDDVFTALAIAFIGGEHSTLRPRDRAQLACSNRRALIIVEGAELADGRDNRCSLDALCSVFDPANCRLILTRELGQADPSEWILLEEALGREDAAALLRLRTGGALPDGLLQPVLELLDGHPLALTWAGGLLARGERDPATLVRSWKAADLPSLQDPSHRNRTLQWLFERSTEHLDADATVALEAAGLLAHDAFPFAAIAASLEKPERAQRALDTLVLASLLRRSATVQDHYQFTHVLGYRFARREDDASPEAQMRLAQWLRAYLAESIASSRGGDHALSLLRPLRHIEALLRSDSHSRLWNALSYFVLYDADDRIAELGQIEARRAALAAVSSWFDRMDSVTRQQPAWLHSEAILVVCNGDVLMQQGDLRGALASYETARDIRARLSKADPTNTDWQRNLSISIGKVGDIRKEQGDLRSALLSYEASRDMVGRLAESNPANLGWQRDLSLALTRVGDAKKGQGDLPGALGSYEGARDIVARLAESSFEHALLKRDLSVLSERIGNIQQEQGDLRGALESYEASRDIRADLAKADPANAGLQHDLAVAMSKVGGVQLAQDDLGGALESYEAARDIAARLAKADPANASWQRDLSISLGKVGVVQEAQGELRSALASHEKAKDIVARLAKADPTNAGWQRDLSYTLTRLAFVHERLREVTKALEYALASLAIDERLAALDPTNAMWQRDVAVSRAQVERLKGEA